MKILHVVPTYWPATRYGGPIYSVHGLCAGLVSQGVDVSVMTTSVDGPVDSLVEHGKPYYKDGVEILYYQSKILRRIYYSLDLKRALNLKLKEFDLVHLHSVFLYPTNIAARIAKQNRIPYVLSPRGMLEKPLIKNKSRFIKSSWLALFEKKTIEQSSLLHLTSQRELEQLKPFKFRYSKSVVIANGVDNVVEKLPARSFDDRVFQLLFIGRINRKKRIELIIKALPFLDFPVRLIIAGNDEDGYKTELEELILMLNLNTRDNLEISFSGEMLNQQKQELFINSDVMILPSVSENFGNTVIEAMAYGCPVIVTPQVGASEVVRTAQAGLISDGSPESIAACLSEIKNFPLKAISMSENGIKAIQQNYLWPVIASRMIQSYKSILSNSV